MSRSRRHVFFVLFFLVFACSIHAQNRSVNDKIKPAFEKYFGLPRASLFLHLNKNAFVQGEHLWFKGYLYNRLKALPFDEPVNLYVGIYDDDGNQIKQHLFISKDGYSQGQIKIDSTLKKGRYYLKAYTSWMRNFKEDDAFTQQFTVLGEAVVSGKASSDARYDIQFLPEGGHWVTDVQGVLGIKAIDEKGKSVAFLSGVIRNQKGEKVSSFVTNQFGLAKVTMVPAKGDTFWASVQTGNGSTKRIALPKAAELGLALSVKNIADNRIMILVGTNAQTKKQIGSKPHSILIHRDGLLKNVEVTFAKEDHYVSHILEKKEFHKGMNVITLVDYKGDPIAERLFFNFDRVQDEVIKAAVKSAGKDSLSIVLSSFKEAEVSSLSISVLPKETKAYQNDFNIESSFLVKPYLKGFVENLRYYFEERSKVKESEFDLLLLTQGWSKYDWENIYGDPLEKRYDFRTGIDVLGQINSALPKKSQLLLYSGKNTNPQIVSTDQGLQLFSLNNYYFEDGEELRLTILNRRGDLERPNLYLRTDTGAIEDKIYELYPKGFDNLIAPKFNSVAVNDFVLPDNTIALEEVIVSEDRRKKKITTPVIPERKIKKMTLQTERLFPNLIDLIRSNGFNVWEMPNTGYDRIRITTKRPLVFSLTQPSPILYIDDVRYSDFNILLDFKSTKIESYFIDRSGNGEPGGAGGVIRVYTRKEGEMGASGSQKPDRKTKFFTHKLSGGFTTLKKYYTPKYRSFVDDSFQNFGTIHWEPNLALDANGKGEFKIYNAGLQEMILYIEGMHTDGTLFSSKKVLKVSLNQ
ncbi:MAG: hypothetical protein ABJN95_20110 [Maribacter sp.]|uniref:hypothetical protein n=1 Tax=Maribacter sp. TaxID=1897614 RepID=UPI003298EEA5